MAPVAGVVAHGGALGALVEGLVALAVVAVILAVWLRERSARGEGEEQGDSEGAA